MNGSLFWDEGGGKSETEDTRRCYPATKRPSARLASVRGTQGACYSCTLYIVILGKWPRENGSVSPVGRRPR